MSRRSPLRSGVGFGAFGFFPQPEAKDLARTTGLGWDLLGEVIDGAMPSAFTGLPSPRSVPILAAGLLLFFGAGGLLLAEQKQRNAKVPSVWHPQTRACWGALEQREQQRQRAERGEAD